MIDRRLVRMGAAACALLLGLGRASAQVNWQPGTGIAGAQGQSIAYDLSTPGTAYFGGGGGLVYKTTDNGATWSAGSPLDTPLATPRGIAVVPDYPNIVYVAATDFVFHANGGLYRSVDGGAHFSKVRNFRTAAGLQLGGRVVTDPSGSRVVYGDRLSGIWLSNDGAKTFKHVVTAGNAFLVADETATALYATNGKQPVITRSLDGGNTWSAIAVGTLTSLQPVTAVGVDPREKLTIYAAYTTVDQYGNSIGGGIWKSTDGGNTWPAANNVAIPAIAFAPGAGINQVLVDPTKSSFVMAALLNGVTPVDLFRTGNGGQSWFADGRTVGFDSPGRLAISGVNNAYPDTILVAGSGGVAKSSDLGKSFTLSNGGLAAPELYAFAANLAVPGSVYAGTPTGIYHSTDNGGTWRNIANWPGDHLTELVAIDSKANPAIAYAVTETKIWRSGDDGQTWASVALPAAGTPYYMWTDPLTAGRVYASYGDNVLYSSSDRGATWTANTIGPASANADLSGLLVSPVKRGTLYAATSAGLFMSTDHGASWTQSNAEMVAAAAVAAVWLTPINTLLVEGEDSGGNWHLYSSTDSGQTWTVLNNPGIAPGASDTGGAGIALASQPAGRAVFAAYPNPHSPSGLTTIWESLDGGAHWKAVATKEVEESLGYGFYSFTATPTQVEIGGGYGGFYLGTIQ